MFDTLSRFPVRGERYAAAMSWFSTGPGLEVRHILDALNWHSLSGGKVVDVGGSYGSVSIALAQSYPFIRCIVQDKTEVITAGRK